MAYIPMIDLATGEIDHLLVQQRADARACREWGGPNPPPAYIRESVSWCIERSRAERRQWQRMRSLPVDGEGPGEVTMMCGYGSGDDGFGYSYRGDR